MSKNFERHMESVFKNKIQSEKRTLIYELEHVYYKSKHLINIFKDIDESQSKKLFDICLNLTKELKNLIIFTQKNLEDDL